MKQGANTFHHLMTRLNGEGVAVGVFDEDIFAKYLSGRVGREKEYWALVERATTNKLDAFKTSDQFNDIRAELTERVGRRINDFNQQRVDALLAQNISLSELDSLRLDHYVSKNSRGWNRCPGDEPHIIAVLGAGKPCAFIEGIVGDGSFQSWFEQEATQSLMSKVGVNIFLSKRYCGNNNYTRKDGTTFSEVTPDVHNMFYYNYDLMRSVIRENMDLLTEEICERLGVNREKADLTNSQIDNFFKAEMYHEQFLMGIILGYGRNNSELHSTGQFQNMTGADDLLDYFDANLTRDEELNAYGQMMTGINDIGTTFSDSLDIMLTMKQGANTFHHLMTLLSLKSVGKHA